MGQLAAGARLGVHEIVGPVGAGGMGEVYKARDTRLDRFVAIKILPERLAADQEFRERFDREARAISQLAHPNVCTLFDVGHHGGVDYLVLEYLDGESLEARLAKSALSGSPGGLPIAEALRVAIEIAAALDAAHRAGIVHRDLKPANVVLTKSGAKLLDFGLAKASAPVVAASGLSMLPTTPPAAVTAQGAILGTFQYMAPEQIEGLEADARTDIFALGCVLFEMLTGRKAFVGNTRASLLGAILKDEPRRISVLRSDSPPALDRIVATCLAKEPDDRWQTARDLWRELKWSATSETPERIAVTTSSGWRRVMPWAVAAVAVLVAIAAVTISVRNPSRAAGVARMSAAPGTGIALALPPSPVGAAAVLSPNAMTLAFVGQSKPGEVQLFVRHLDQLVATALPGTDGASSPFFSPDGQWVAFFANGKLKKTPTNGGAVVTICDAPNPRGGSWAEDGTIILAPLQTGRVQHVSSAGGTPEPVGELATDEATQRWPQVIAGGKAVLFTANRTTGGAYDDAVIVLQALPSGPRKIIHRGGYYGRYVSSGHLLYVQNATVFAVAFDPNGFTTIGAPVPVAEGVSANPGYGGAQFDAAGDNFIYVPGQALGPGVPMQWLTSDGKTSVLRATPVAWFTPRFSPDGRRLAFSASDDRQDDVWIYDWARDTPAKLTLNNTDDESPVWTPDGQRIAFASRRGDNAVMNIYWQRADGSGEAQRLTVSKNNQIPGSFSPDGKLLAFSETTVAGDDVMVLPIEGDENSGWRPGKPYSFVATSVVERNPAFSPDGRWIAYDASETATPEVYVRPFPGPGGKWVVSANGGALPAWSRARPELLYVVPGERQIMAASFTADGGVFRAEKPHLWATPRVLIRPRGRFFDLHPDGNRIVAAVESDDAPRQDKIIFVLNFADELRRLAPSKR